MRLRTVAVVALLGFVLLVVPLPSRAQKPPKVHRIGMLMAHSPGTPAYMEPFYQELRDLGYVEEIGRAHV